MSCVASSDRRSLCAMLLLSRLVLPVLVDVVAKGETLRTRYDGGLDASRGRSTHVGGTSALSTRKRLAKSIAEQSVQHHQGAQCRRKSGGHERADFSFSFFEQGESRARLSGLCRCNK